MTASDPQLLAIPMVKSDRVDVYSGVARHSGMLWASLHSPTTSSDTVVVVAHPSSNFLGHYFLPVLASLGVNAVGFNTRYIGNDSALIMENCVLDLGACVKHLRSMGFKHIILIGNSGGGGLVSLYQSQAERPSIVATPAGDPPDLTKAGLEPADAVVEFMAHPGRAIVYTNWLDPAILDESEPFDRNSELDMFNDSNGPPYSRDFLHRYRIAQRERNIRITTWVEAQLRKLTDGELADDLPFVVHGTCADPRFLDLSLEPSAREAGSLWGEPRLANFLPTSLGHYSSLRSWLSQWGIETSNGDGPRHLSEVSVPVLVMYGTADNSCFPSDAFQLYEAVKHERKELIALEGANHYFESRRDLLEEAGRLLIQWLRTWDVI